MRKEAIDTLRMMQSTYSHIRKSEAEWQAIEAAIEALEENERLKETLGDSFAQQLLEKLNRREAELENAKKEFDRMTDRCAEVLNERDSARAERDAAIADIKRCCDTCISRSQGCRGYEPSACGECVNWEWHGGKKEE